MNRWQNLWRFIPLFGLMMLLLTGCGSDTISALKPRGPVARDQLFLMQLSLGIMVIVVLVVFAIYIYVLIRFRKKKGDKDIIPKQVEGSHTLEIIWTVIPIILLLILAVPTVSYTVNLSANHIENKEAIHVKVTAHQFWWQFDYPKLGIATAQDLVIPVNKKIALEITSADVIHSFWVPSLAGKQDTNVGMTNIMYLEADEAEVFLGKCAELCGDSHALMDFKVVSKSEADFNAWVEDMKTPVAIPAEAKAGEQVFKDNCLSCHAVSADGLGFGPNLNGFAKREMIAGVMPRGAENDRNLHAWIVNPQEVKPDTQMPPVPLQEQQVNDLIKYLNALK
ncbi:cytochrome c oxidase subunit II [Paenibacillus xerothermodurans]|uniref:Cytochrome c oxidase subunit 2 n=1 Tax=Paenibacillus xerothermodurans TaxID=1977292 RepID=A0A2W1NY39_PAEXE|nr:cytochrome c oxidase subunit II [Paenibacillus xerothermodurans]PZE19768.1 cytochrome c oxidase subunit II [Paenibacillus xerothermodurans]